MLRSSIVERALILAGTAITCACASAAQLPVSAGFGAQPTLPPPDKSAIPLVKVATARGWPDGQKPVAAEGTTVTAFAQGLQHPRWLYVLPNGDVLVAETNGPERPEDNKGIKGKIFKHYYAKAGSAVPSANRITLLRDADGDGVAETRSIFASGLNSPFGRT
jgi:glucose/arabinose dehydrogenase